MEVSKYRKNIIVSKYRKNIIVSDKTRIVMNWSGLLGWLWSGLLGLSPSFYVGVVTLIAIVIFNVWSVKRIRRLHEDMVNSLKPSVNCELEEASPEKFKFRITNTSAIRFVVRARLLINGEELKVKFWNEEDVNQFLRKGKVDKSQLIKPIRLLYPQLPASTTLEPGGPWAAHISPGESRVFSTSPFPAQLKFGRQRAKNAEKEIKNAGKELEEFEREIGMELTGKNRIPDQLKDVSSDGIETVKVEIEDPNIEDPSAGSFLFQRGKDFHL